MAEKIKKYFQAVFLISGTIIGVGFFSLPFLFFQLGWRLMLLYFLILGTLVTTLHFMFGEVAIRSPDFKRLPGFAKLYLGKWGERVAYLVILFGLFGTLLAYLILGGTFLNQFWGGVLGGQFFWTIIYFFLGSMFISFGVRAISKIEFLDSFLFVVFLIIVVFYSKFPFQAKDITPPSLNDPFLPYGIVLFSLWGTSIIPDTEEFLRGEKRMLRLAILFAMILCILFYFLFGFFVSNICQSKCTPDGLSGLKDFFHPSILKFFFLFGVFTTFTSFVALGLVVKNTLFYDLKMSNPLSLLITVCVPLLLFLLGIQTFLSVISFVGSVMLGLEGILISLMYKRLHPTSQIIYPMIFVFLMGIFYEFVYLSR